VPRNAQFLLGNPNARKLKRFQALVSDTTCLRRRSTQYSDDQLRAKTATSRQMPGRRRIPARQAPALMNCSPRAFAVVPRSRQAGAHAPLSTQLIAAGAARRPIADMKPAKAKPWATLPPTSTPLTAPGARGDRKRHLARRRCRVDGPSASASWPSGLTNSHAPSERTRILTAVTSPMHNSELASTTRDNIPTTSKEVVTTKLQLTCIIDEVDSILVMKRAHP